MFFITCFSNFESEYLDNYRTFGYFGNYAMCRKAGSVGMKKEKDFTKQRNPSGQTVGTVLHWDNF